MLQAEAEEAEVGQKELVAAGEGQHERRWLDQEAEGRPGWL